MAMEVRTVFILLLPYFKTVFFKGGTVAKFAGNHVHKRLVTEETYREKDYEAALKRAFLGTDEDLLAGKSKCVFSVFLSLIHNSDPITARDSSGCTAVAALIAGNKLYVVCNLLGCSPSVPLTSSIG